MVQSIEKMAHNWKLDNHVTIQSASASTSVTYSRYFTPHFHRMQHIDRRPHLKQLAKEWKSLMEEERSAFSTWCQSWPSPSVASTDPVIQKQISDQSLFILLSVQSQSLEVVLFP